MQYRPGLPEEHWLITLGAATAIKDLLIKVQTIFHKVPTFSRDYSSFRVKN